MVQLFASPRMSIASSGAVVCKSIARWMSTCIPQFDHRAILFIQMIKNKKVLIKVYKNDSSPNNISLSNNISNDKSNDLSNGYIE